MAAGLRWDEGTSGWVLLAGVVLGGVALCALGGYLGARLACIAIDNNFQEID